MSLDSLKKPAETFKVTTSQTMHSCYYEYSFKLRQYLNQPPPVKFGINFASQTYLQETMKISATADQKKPFIMAVGGWHLKSKPQSDHFVVGLFPTEILH